MKEGKEEKKRHDDNDGGSQADENKKMISINKKNVFPKGGQKIRKDGGTAALPQVAATGSGRSPRIEESSEKIDFRPGRQQ